MVIVLALIICVAFWAALFAMAQPAQPHRQPETLNDHVHQAIQAARNGVWHATGYKVQHETFEGTSGGHPLLVCLLADRNLVSWCDGVMYLCASDGSKRSNVRIKTNRDYFLAKVDAGVIT